MIYGSCTFYWRSSCRCNLQCATTVIDPLWRIDLIDSSLGGSKSVDCFTTRLIRLGKRVRIPARLEFGKWSDSNYLTSVKATIRVTTKAFHFNLGTPVWAYAHNLENIPSGALVGDCCQSPPLRTLVKILLIQDQNTPEKVIERTDLFGFGTVASSILDRKTRCSSAFLIIRSRVQCFITQIQRETSRLLRWFEFAGVLSCKFRGSLCWQKLDTIH